MISIQILFFIERYSRVHHIVDVYVVGVDIVVVDIVGVVSVDVVLPPGLGGATADGKQPRLRDPDTHPRFAAKGQ